MIWTVAFSSLSSSVTADGAEEALVALLSGRRRRSRGSPRRSPLRSPPTEPRKPSLLFSPVAGGGDEKLPLLSIWGSRCWANGWHAGIPHPTLPVNGYSPYPPRLQWVMPLVNHIHCPYPYPSELA
jgi:hypothetical protein